MYNKISSFLNRHKGIVLIICLGMIFRLIYFLIILRNFGSEGFYLTSNGDAAEYLALARQWLWNGTFQNLSGLPVPEIFRMPGLPLFIAFFYKIIPDVSLSILAQNIIFIFSAAFFYKFAALITGSKKISLLASALLYLEPSIIYWNSQLITETLFAVFIFFSVYSAFIVYREKKFVFSASSGLFLALANFIRPAGEYLLFVFFIFYGIAFFGRIISFKKFILIILLFFIGFVAPLSPWMARNKDVFGSFAISNSSNIGFGKYLTAISEQLGEDGEKLRIKTPYNILTRAGIRRKMFIAYVASHPIIFIKIYSASLVPFFLGDAYIATFGRIVPSIENNRIVTDWRGGGYEFFDFLRGHQGAEAFVFFFGKAVWVSIIFSAVIGFFYWIFKYKKNYPILILLSLLIFYFSLASGIGSYSRFRFPINPYIFILAGFGVRYLSIAGIIPKIRLTRRRGCDNIL